MSSRKIPRIASFLLRHAATAAALVLIWQALRFAAGPEVLPSPVESFKLLWEQMQGREFWGHAMASVMRLGRILPAGTCARAVEAT